MKALHAVDFMNLREYNSIRTRRRTEPRRDQQLLEVKPIKVRLVDCDIDEVRAIGEGRRDPNRRLAVRDFNDDRGRGFAIYRNIKVWRWMEMIPMTATRVPESGEMLLSIFRYRVTLECGRETPRI